MNPIVLDLDESPPDHPFAAVDLYHSDLALLNYLLQDLRTLVRRTESGHMTLAHHQTITWTVHGLRRRTVICDPDRLLLRAPVHIVGFLGNRRATSDRLAVEEVEIKLLGEFKDHPGILSYSSVELVDDQWANLVVHLEPDDRQVWRNSRTHVYAAEDLSPSIYHDVRIHSGCISDGPVGSGTVVIDGTKYWDYDCSPPWHAVRTLPGGAVETVGSLWNEIV